MPPYGGLGDKLTGGLRIILSMREKSLISHAEAERVLRRAGYSTEQIEDILGRFPDPIDIDRDGDALFELGISRDRLRDRMGFSP